MTSHRRDFVLSTGSAVALGMSAVTSSPLLSASPQNRIQIGLIGTGGMGSNHLRTLCQRKDILISHLADVDSNRLASAVELVETSGGGKPNAVTDFRRILDQKEIDAVFIATPDHWHSPAAILALDAGKHVYVEKPVSHNVREGRLLIEAVKRSGKQLQVGTQSRSGPTVISGIKRVHSGEIGEILVAKAWNSQRRGTIGKTEPTEPPPQLNFEDWLGPAQKVPYRTNLLHGVWRWWYDFGCGDMGNDGVHDIDVAIWGLGVQSHPERVACMGRKAYFDDDQQYPDTQYSVAEYAADGRGKKKQLVFEQRIWTPYVQEGYENGAAFYGTEGYMIMGHTMGWKLYGPRNKLIAEESGALDLVPHHTNFFQAIRGEVPGTNAPAEIGHRAATFVHLSNIAARLRTELEFDPQSERVLNSPEGDRMLTRDYRKSHWGSPKDA